jgi:nitrogen fixation NifU-like protein
MSELRDLYQEIILDHYKRPRNQGRPADANRQADGHNPLCGDKVTIFLTLQDGVIRDVAFQGQGCAISTASASLMTDKIKGMTEPQARALFAKFKDMVTSPMATSLGAAPDVADLDALAAFSGVREFPLRVKCATLPWHTLVAALDDHHMLVKTE